MTHIVECPSIGISDIFPQRVDYFYEFLEVTEVSYLVHLIEGVYYELGFHFSVHIDISFYHLAEVMYIMILQRLLFPLLLISIFFGRQSLHAVHTQRISFPSLSKEYLYESLGVCWGGVFPSIHPFIYFYIRISS